jgi:OOP family OmpA-OmpF porin
MKAIIGACVSFLLLTASFGAHAQATGVKLNMDSGLYVGAGLGRSEAREFCLHIGGGACDQKDTSWNAFVGYQVNRHFAVELGYVDLGKSFSSGLLGGVPATASLDTTAIELLAVGMLPLSDAFSIYGKFGMYRYETDSVSTGPAAGAGSADDVEFTIGIGGQYGFTRNIAVRAEWQRYFEVGSGVFGLEKSDTSVWRVVGRYMF